MKWTKDQQRVIELHGRSLLVSAAAGSGKTAVLVERIIAMTARKENPVDIDRLLVVTFTRAAAAEMKERIGRAFKEKLLQDPKDPHLKRQTTLLHHASIMTIDSFCLFVVRNYFNQISMDPNFRIGDEGEIKLLKADVMAQLMEDCYQSGEPAFLDLVESYATDRSDQALEEYIDRLYEFAQGNPWPKDWFAFCKEQYAPEDLRESPWLSWFMSNLQAQLKELEAQLTLGLSMAREPGGPYMYEDMLAGDLAGVRQLLKARDLSELAKDLWTFTFLRLSSKKDESVDPDKKAAVQDLRNRVKKALQTMKKEIQPREIELAWEDRERQRPLMEALIDLVQEYGRRLQQAKAEKNILDFSDIEHSALQILVRREKSEETGEYQLTPTEAAKELMSRYEEIMIDEYQDSNLLQETILKSISREQQNAPNIFMVGDVKQSIYKFRLARPELFMEKYQSYTKEESPRQKIDLHQNFRSRPGVLGDANFFFSQIMTRALGNIEYDKEAALYPGADFPETAGGEEEQNYRTEILLAKSEPEVWREQLDADYHAREMEAYMAADRIRKLTDPKTGLLVFDKEKKRYRRAQYRDIVILLRSFSGWGETFCSVLNGEGIPAYAQSTAGYFDALEVKVILNLLRVLDNPMQDIPLAAVLKSGIGEMTDAQLAEISGFCRRKLGKNEKRTFYQCCRMYLEEGEDGELKEKLSGVLKELEDLSRMKNWLSLHELIREIYRRTGYYLKCSSMPGGEVRTANLDMLLVKAVDFEKTSYHGLFQFIRYIDHLKKYEVDFGEASIYGEKDNLVRITTIHKSKGLEFPIVFVAGIGKKFNQQDGREKILLHSDMGIAGDLVDLENRVRRIPLMKKVWKRRLLLENLGEELRVLYVAFTRAKEKLILTGTDRYLDGKLEKMQTGLLWKEEKLPFTSLSGAGSYLDWILLALSRNKPDSIEVRTVDLGEILVKEEGTLLAGEGKREELLAGTKSLPVNEDVYEALKERMDYEYPFVKAVKTHAKMSVSEIKHLYEEQEEEAARLPEVQDAEEAKERGEEMVFEPSLPQFMREDKPLRGAQRGTAYHRMLELIDFSVPGTAAELKRQAESLLERGLVSKETVETVYLKQMERLFASPLGKRLREAACRKKLYREQQFVMGVSVDEGEEILVQGVIDAWFEEEGQAVIVDYKTDYLARGQEKILLSRYRSQVLCYKKALEQITGMKVKECYIYSFALGKAIGVEEDCM